MAGKKNVVVEDNNEEVVEETVTVTPPRKMGKREYMIPASNDPNAPEFEYVSVNGKSWYVQVGVPVMLPECAIKVLENRRKAEAEAAKVARARQQAYLEAVAKLNSGQVAPY